MLEPGQVQRIGLQLLPQGLTSQALLALVVFVVFVALAYRLFKVALGTIIAAAAGAAFPWVVKWFNLDIPVTASLENSILWAGLAAFLYLGYEFVHYLYWGVRVITWPIRVVLGMEKKRKFSQMARELEEIRKQRKREGN